MPRANNYIVLITIYNKKGVPGTHLKTADILINPTKSLYLPFASVLKNLHNYIEIYMCKNIPFTITEYLWS